MSPEKQRMAIAEACGPKLFVIHKPIHDPFGYYRENACGYTSNLSEAWKVTEEIARKHIGGKPSDADRVIMEPAPLPDYLHNRSAMIEALDISLTAPKWAEFGELLAIRLGYDDDYYEGWTISPCRFVREILTAPLGLISECLLRTIGKWEDT